MGAEEKVRSAMKRQERLPRGIERRARSLVVYLTDADGHRIRRSVGANLTIKMANQQREIWQREIAEWRRQQVPRAARVTFRRDCRSRARIRESLQTALGHDAGRIAKMKSWWGVRLADEITTAEIDARLLE
jgi:hypothetical protein